MKRATSSPPKVWWLLPPQHEPSRGADMLWVVADIAVELGIGGGLVCLSDVPAPNPQAAHAPVIASLADVLSVGVQPHDILFVNQVSDLAELSWPGQCWLFVQGTSTLMFGLMDHSNLQEAAVQGAWAVMPNLVEVIERWSPLPLGCHLVPACVGWADAVPLGILPWGERPKELVLYPKGMYTSLGQMDHAFLTATLSRVAKSSGWRVTQLQGMSPEEVEALFRRARLFINTNTFESLNASVVEAMAGGCLVHTYNAIGGVDHLEEGRNARVFENLDVFAQLSAAVEVMTANEAFLPKATRMQAAGWATARQYSRAQTRAAMEKWWAQMAPRPAECAITVVIPTMWRSSKTPDLLRAWQAVPNVEVLVIDNEPASRPPGISGVRWLEQSENISVNPAWNCGASVARGAVLVLCNDDILFDAPRWAPVLVEALAQRPLGIVGLHPMGFNRTDEMLGSDVGACTEGHFVGLGWGCLLACRASDYRQIPKGLRINWGDQWLAEQLVPYSMAIPMVFEASATSSDAVFTSTKKQDDAVAFSLGMRYPTRPRPEDLPARQLDGTAFTLRLATPSDQSEIAAGFAEAFHHERSEEEWAWRYDRPWHPSIRQIGCDPEGKIVAHVGWYTDRAQIQGQPVLCMQGGDVFRVGPVSRKDLSLISALHLDMFAQLDKAQSIAWTFGFQAPKIRARSARSYGTHIVEPLMAYSRSTASPGRGLRLPWKQPRATILDAVDQGLAVLLDELWQRCMPRYFVSLIRDAQWFTYRYDRHPSRRYHHVAVKNHHEVLVAWGVVGERLGSAMLIDFIWDGARSKDFEALLQGATEQARELGHSTISTWVLGDPEALKLLEQNGWHTGEDPQQLGIAIRHVHPALHPSDIRGRHYVTAGYSDLV